MAPGEKTVREALRGNVQENRQQMDITEESRLMLRDTLRNEMSDAFAAGLQEAMTSDNAKLFVRAMLTEAQRMATEKSVEVAGGVLKALLGRALLFLFLGSIVYALGGWTALAAMGKFFSKG